MSEHTLLPTGPPDDGPLVTIGIPAHNNARHIAVAIESALAQTYERLEIIVVDDASTDDTVLIARRFSDPRLRVVINEANLGLARNHDRVIALAEGEYVKILHADDRIAPDAVARQVAAMQGDPSVVLVTSKRSIIGDDGARIAGRGPRWPEGVRDGRSTIRECVRAGQNLLGEPTAALFRRETALAAGGFSEDWPYVVDLEFSVRLLMRGNLYYIVRELASFRVSPSQQSASLADVHAEDAIRLFGVIRDDHGLGLTDKDVAKGARVARRDARLRRVLYGILAMPESAREKVAYVFVGAWNTGFSYAVFAILWALFAPRLPYWAILAITTVMGTLNGFIMQRRFVFRSQGRVLSEFGRFALVYAVIGALNVLAFPALVRLLHLGPYVSQAVFTVFIIIAGYVANKYFSFRSS